MCNLVVIFILPQTLDQLKHQKFGIAASEPHKMVHIKDKHYLYHPGATTTIRHSLENAVQDKATSDCLVSMIKHKNVKEDDEEIL